MGVYYEGLVLIANKFASAEHKAFTDFSLGTQIASDLNLVRVTNGDRYQEQLVPTFEDKTASVKGQTGSYYFGTVYKEMPITINVAFDNLSESDFSKLKKTYRSTLGRGIPEPLILDDCPYKYYMVVFNGAVNFNYVPFDEDGITIYKGEATLSFVCYDGWAREIEKGWGYDYEDRLKKYGRSLQDNFYNTGREIHYNSSKTFVCEESTMNSPGIANGTGYYAGTTYFHIPVWNLGDYPVFPFIIMKKKTKENNFFSTDIIIVHRENQNEDTQQKLTINIPNNSKFDVVCLDCSRDIAFGFNSQAEISQIQYLTIKHNHGGAICLKPRYGQEIELMEGHSDRCMDNIGFNIDAFPPNASSNYEDYIAINYNYLYI